MPKFTHDDDATLYFSGEDEDPIFGDLAVSDEVLGDSIEGCPEEFLEGFEEDLL